MNQPGLYLGRAYDGYLISLRKKIALFLVCLFVVVAITIYSSLIVRVQRKYTMKQQVADMQNRLRFLEANYNEISEATTDKRFFQNDFLYGRRNRSSYNTTEPDMSWTNESTAVYDLLKNLTGTRTAAGIYTANNQQLRIAFIYQLLPHLMEDADSLKPAYHMRSSRYFTDLVVGIPTHKRGQESFLIFTLSQLVNGLTPADKENTLIIVFIAETDIEYVINMARKIEITFPTQVEDGLIEVFSPSPSYYPNFETLRGTMGDSREKVKRQAKENLDNIFLMAYAQARGMYVLLLADDLIANENYIKVIKKFTISVTVSNPKWFYIEYCHVGGIGKLFRSADLIHFITYVQLFYKNQPFDWLLESYLADKTCVVLQISNTCAGTTEVIQPKYKLPLFQQIGLYTSENENNQNIEDLQIGPDPTFYPHTSNPPLQSLKTDIWVHPDHSLEAAYQGKTFFWGKTPKKGDIIEFWFKKPITLDRYKFRSGNSEHNTDKFYDTCVEVLPVRDNIAYTPKNCFDAVGLAEGRLMEQIAAIRLKVNRDSNYWVILSEIQLSEYQPPDKGS